MFSFGARGIIRLAKHNRKDSTEDAHYGLHFLLTDTLQPFPHDNPRHQTLRECLCKRDLRRTDVFGHPFGTMSARARVNEAKSV